MATASATITDGSTGSLLTFGKYTVRKVIIQNTDTTASSVTFFDSDDTNKAIVHGATVTLANSQVDRYTKYRRSTTSGQEGKPYLLTGDASTSIDVPPSTAPATADPDDVASAYEYQTSTGTTQTQKFTGIIQTSSAVTANSVTVPAFLSLSVAAGQTLTYTAPTSITLARGLVATASGGDVSVTVEY